MTIDELAVKYLERQKMTIEELKDLAKLGITKRELDNMIIKNCGNYIPLWEIPTREEVDELVDSLSACKCGNSCDK